jgi:hypothetical protein
MGRETSGAGAPTTVPRELQLLWLSLVQRSWRSLAVVPCDDSVTARLAAAALAEIAAFYDLGPVETLDAIGALSGDGPRLAQDLAARVEAGKRVVVLVDPPLKGLGGFPLVVAAEVAVLLVRYGSPLATVQGTIGLVGREKVLGCITIEGHGAKG